MSNIFCVDFGTRNIKIFNKNSNEILNEKNVIAIANKKEIIAIGDDAYEMHEKVPENIQVVFPINSGVVADYNIMRALYTEFLYKSAKGKFRGASHYVAIPTDITRVEKKAFMDLIKAGNLRAREIHAVEKPIANAVGLGIDVKSAKGIMIVDIGSDTTEISVVSFGGIIHSMLLKIGGNRFDESIIAHLKREKNIEIGRKTAAALKKELCEAISEEKKTTKTYGRDLISGLPSLCEVDSSVIYNSVEGFISQIVDSIKMILEKTVPELGADIVRNGIYITGGSSQIGRLDELIGESTHLKVNSSERPSESVVRGLMKIALNKEYRSLVWDGNERINEMDQRRS